MSASGLAFQLHAIIGMTLFTIWSFTRLVHAFAAPLGYLFRPYVVLPLTDRRTSGSPVAPRLGESRLTVDLAPGPHQTEPPDTTQLEYCGETAIHTHVLHQARTFIEDLLSQRGPRRSGPADLGPRFLLTWV
jgi:hypothetical protein